MTDVPTVLSALMAVGVDQKEATGFPLHYQIATLVLGALFILTFSVARDPRGWRRLYQSKFTRKEEFSVNRNKRIDEGIKKYGISVSMVFLVAAVACFLLGVTYHHRHSNRPMSAKEKFMQEDTDRILENTPKEATRRAAGG
jgi:hypothetical protein